MNDRIRHTAAQALFAGLLMCLYGWFMTAKGVSSSAAYNGIVDVFYWMLRIGGILMLIGGALCYGGMRIGVLVDAITAGVCGAIMLLYGVAGPLTGVKMGINNVLALIFGVLFLSAARGSSMLYLASVGSTAKRPIVRPVNASPVVEPIHPASVRPPGLPGAGDPPPADGYLAALAREDEEPPTASFE